MTKRDADGSVRALSRAWASLDDNLSQRIDLLTLVPTPSCQAFKAAFKEGMIFPVLRSLRNPFRLPTWSCLGRRVAKIGYGGGLCRECFRERVTTEHTQPLWVGNRDSGYVDLWWIADESCRRCRPPAPLEGLYMGAPVRRLSHWNYEVDPEQGLMEF